MEVPFRLVRRDAPASAADAFLLLTADTGALASASVGLGPVPAVHAVRGGFLLVPAAAESRAVPGTIKLRRLAGDLFVPTDANLIPALLPDEAIALTRDRGLVVLPGGTILAFEVAPLEISQWLAPASVRRSEWKSLPARPDRPNALTVIERPVPPVVAVIEMLGSGAPDGARPLPGAGEPGAKSGAVPDDARPAPGSALGRAVAGAGFATGGMLAWLGKQLGSNGLARLGGDLAKWALDRVPRLSEKLFGDQEAALREVLRQLQSGDVEKGLTRAPVAVPDPDVNRPARIGTDARLGARDPRYSLRELIAGGGGVTTAWLGGGDVWAELAREYRRLAAEASARGDYRRAAYLHGVLLRDLRAAANALLAGGLYRDAALILRDRLNDLRGAADAFDRAGDHDEALRLYERLKEYERAAELLRRLGEEERAVEYFRRAAEQLVGTGTFLAAGDLLRVKAHRRDLAADVYRRGWVRAVPPEDVPCAERLFDEARESEDAHALEVLVEEAEASLAGRPRDAGRLFNYALRTGNAFLPDDAREELADRVKILFAGHLRTYAVVGEAGAMVSELFPLANWAPPVGRDATFATRVRAPESPAEVSLEPDRQLVAGPVTAVAVVRGTFDVLVAGAGGIVLWRVAQGTVAPVFTGGERVTALAASRDGGVVYALALGADGALRLRCFVADRGGAFRATTQYTLPTVEGADPAAYLQPAAVFRADDYRITVATPGANFAFAGPYLQFDPAGRFVTSGWPVCLLAETADDYAWSWEGGFVWMRPPGDRPPERWVEQWTQVGPLDWLAPAPAVLEVAGVDVRGHLRWAEFDARNDEAANCRTSFAIHPNGYVAACLVAPGVVAAVTTRNEVIWLRAAAGDSMPVLSTVSVGGRWRVLALARRPDERDVIAVLADGGGVRLRRP